MESAPHFCHSYKLVTPVSRTKFSPPTFWISNIPLTSTTSCISSNCNNNNNYSNNCAYKLKPLVPSAITLTLTEALALVLFFFSSTPSPTSGQSRPPPPHHLERLVDNTPNSISFFSPTYVNFERPYLRNGLTDFAEILHGTAPGYNLPAV